MENVFSIVAPNPRYRPRIPSCLYIRDITANIEKSSLPFPLLLAWILVLALQDIRSDNPTAWTYATYTSNGYTTLSSFQYHYIISEKTATDAELKQPPNAPANAAPKGVSCWTGFDWIGIDEGRSLDISSYHFGRWWTGTYYAVELGDTWNSK